MMTWCWWLWYERTINDKLPLNLSFIKDSRESFILPVMDVASRTTTTTTTNNNNNNNNASNTGDMPKFNGGDDKRVHTP